MQTKRAPSNTFQEELSKRLKWWKSLGASILVASVTCASDIMSKIDVAQAAQNFHVSAAFSV